jgi:hypothetical protein
LANHSVLTYRYLFEYRGQQSVVNLQGEIADFGSRDFTTTFDPLSILFE